MKNIVIFGAPGSGRGTQSDKLVQHYGYVTYRQEMFCATKSRTAQSSEKPQNDTSTKDNCCPTAL